MKDVVRVITCRVSRVFLLDGEVALDRQVGDRRGNAAQVDRVIYQRSALARCEVIRGLVLNAYRILPRIDSRPSQPKHVDRNADRSGKEENEKQSRYTFIVNHRIPAFGGMAE